MYSVLLHDKRVSGGTPSRSDTTSLPVDQNTPIQLVLDWVNACYMMKGQIENLAIICHGYENPVNHRGGLGLQLSKDGVYIGNVTKWNAIKGKTNWIIIYACCAADVDPTAPPDQGDGRKLCSQLAIATGAKVIAAVREQHYVNDYVSTFNPFNWDKEIDFGGFEGPMYAFLPDGTSFNITPWQGNS